MPNQDEIKRAFEKMRDPATGNPLRKEDVKNLMEEHGFKGNLTHDQLRSRSRDIGNKMPSDRSSREFRQLQQVRKTIEGLTNPKEPGQ